VALGRLPVGARVDRGAVLFPKIADG
jgi:hypothetical protein